jgi:hypothetical protein
MFKGRAVSPALGSSPPGRAGGATRSRWNAVPGVSSLHSATKKRSKKSTASAQMPVMITKVIPVSGTELCDLPPLPAQPSNH